MCYKWAGNGFKIAQNEEKSTVRHPSGDLIHTESSFGKDRRRNILIDPL